MFSDVGESEPKKKTPKAKTADEEDAEQLKGQFCKTIEYLDKETTIKLPLQREF